MKVRPKILLAEADERLELGVSSALLGGGFEVIVVGHAAHAVSVATREKADAMVLGSSVSGTEQLSVIKRVRALVHTAFLPILVILKKNGKVSKEEMLEAGAQTCLPGPVDQMTLISAVEKYLARPVSVEGAPKEILEAPERLAALHASGLLDSPNHESYDLLTRLVAKLLRVPVGLVSLVDKDRQYFKSQVGLPASTAQARETALSHSFCQWVVSSREDLIVDDAREHPVLRSNGAVDDLGVIAYAGVPLVLADDQAAGALCAIDAKPRRWSELEIATLQDIGKITQTYASLGWDLPRGGQFPFLAPKAYNSYQIQAAGAAMAAATRVLSRGGELLGDTERQTLLTVIEQLAQALLAKAA